MGNLTPSIFNLTQKKTESAQRRIDKCSFLYAILYAIKSKRYQVKYE